jgi:DNA-binding CsgD family transcriptional regulator
VRWPLVGRHDELGRVLNAVAARGAVVLLSGVDGVGRTRLLTEVVATLQRKGRTAAQVTASAATCSTPFAALLPLLGDGPARREVYSVAQALAAGSYPGPQVLAMDDAQWLDEASIAAVELLQHSVDAALLLSVPDGAPLPVTLQHRLAGERADVVTVAPLAAGPFDRLLSTVMDGPLSTTVRAELRRLSLGLPGPLRAVLTGAVDTGRLRVQDGLWVRNGSLAATPHAQAYADRALGLLTGDLRDAFELLTLRTGWPSDLAERLVGLDALIVLESHGLLAADDTVGTTPELKLSPLHREAIAAAMSWGRRRQLHRRLVDVVEAPQGPGWTDRAEQGYQRWSAGLPVPHQAALDAAVRARAEGDIELALAITGSIVDRGSLEAAVCHAECLAAAGRFDEAEHAFTVARRTATGDAEFGRVVLAEAQHLHLPQHDGRRAHATVRTASKRALAGQQRDELQAMEAAFLSFAGDLRAAHLVADDVVARRSSDAAGASALAISTFAATVLGHPANALAQLDEHDRWATDPPPGLPLIPARLNVNRMFALVALGQVHQAVEQARRGYRLAVDSEPVEALGAWMVCLAFALVEHGAAKEAERLLIDASYELERHDPLGVLPAALSYRAYAAALQGNLRAAHHALTMLDGQFADQHRFGTWRDRAQLWCLAAQGNRTRLLEHASTATRRAYEQHLDLWATWFHHDLTRLGQPEPALEELHAAATRLDCTQVELAATHAHALHANDPGQLEDVGTDYAAAGWRLHAAEAFAQAATAHTRAGSNRNAALAAALAQQQLTNCPGARTVRLDTPALTARELEVGHLAATGLSSREIADQLTISVRTVDNHLHRCYRKLGVEGRHALERLL